MAFDVEPVILNVGVRKTCFCKWLLFWFSSGQPGYEELYDAGDQVGKVWPGFVTFIFLPCLGAQRNRLLGASSGNSRMLWLITVCAGCCRVMPKGLS